MSEDVLGRADAYLDGCDPEAYEDNHSIGLLRDLAAALREARKDTERLDWILNDEFARYDPFFKDYRGTLESREQIDAAAKSAKGE